MHSEEIGRAVRELLGRTGVGKQLAEEEAARRRAEHQALRERKAASVKRLLAERPKAEAAVAAAEAKQRAAVLAAEAALQDYIRAREVLDTIVGTHSNELAELHPKMHASCDPRIDDFLAELRAAQAGCANLCRTWPAPNGPYAAADGRRVADNRLEVERRVRAIREAIDEAERLKLAHDVTDVGAELERLRRAIPEA
jgi:chromosome segregation ATPase